MAAPIAASESAPLLYLYAILARDSAAHELLQQGAVRGIHDGTLFAVPSESLVAAVSEVPASRFEEAPLNALLRDLEQLAPFAVHHEAAIQALLPAAPALIPMTFGTVYRDPASVARMLEERDAEFCALLAQLEGRQEWGLRVVQDAALALAAVEQADAVRTLDDAISRATPGRAYLLGRRRAALVQEQAAQQVASTLTAIVERLEGASVAWREYPIVREAVDPAPLVLRAAFLVETAGADRFQQEAAKLDQGYQNQGYRLTVDGPWAPYSFVGRRREPA
jgi:hypothetical protein